MLHHLCWADDLYAMAGTMNHLTRILGMRWKEKSLNIVAGPFTEYKPGDVAEIVSSGKRWVWRVVEGKEALGTWLDNRGCSEASVAQNLQNKLHVLREEGLVLRSQTPGQQEC